MFPPFDVQTPCQNPQVDPEIFYSAERQDRAAAKALCMACPVRQECLEALGSDFYGVVGGKSPSARVGQQHEAVRASLSEGLTATEAADRHGVSVSTIQNVRAA